MADDETVENNSKVKALPGGNSRLRLTLLNDLKLNTSRRDLVKGIIPQTGIVVVWGAPKCGKSFWVMDMLLHACLGWSYRGRKTIAGSVLYCAFEGQGGIPARVEALRQRYLPKNPEIPFYICRDVIDIIKEHKALIAAVRQLPGQRVNAVVLDTLNKSLFGSENKDEDMSAYIRAADAIAETLQCVVIIIHHCGVKKDRPRGHTSLTGALDVQIEVDRAKNSKEIIATIELSKDGPTGDKIISTLEEVTVGQDEEGNPIKTGIIVPAEEAAERSIRYANLAAKPKAAYDTLCKLIEKEGQKLPLDTPSGAGAKGVTLESFRSQLACDALINEKGNPRQQLKRILCDMKEGGVADTYGDFVWASHSQ